MSGMECVATRALGGRLRSDETLGAVLRPQSERPLPGKWKIRASGSLKASLPSPKPSWGDPMEYLCHLVITLRLCIYDQSSHSALPAESLYISFPIDVGPFFALSYKYASSTAVL